MNKILTKNLAVENMHKLHVAKEQGAYSSLVKLRSLKPSDIIEDIDKSGLRGRGGAGFPTAKKWKFLSKNNPAYLIVNADESEPGTFKDRVLIEKDPHLLIEGILIAAYAIGVKTVYVYFRGEYYKAWKIFTDALNEVINAGLIKSYFGHLEIHTHRGAGAYICGEETALINSIEGKRGVPRIKPPFPAEKGLFGAPSIVNNVETLCNLPFILKEGGAAFAAIGTKDSTGTKLISACGHINRPGVYEVDMGTPVASFMAEALGGTINSNRLKAVLPGGPSVPVLKGTEALSSRFDYESMKRAGSQLGSGGFIVMDETASMPRVLNDIAGFFEHESCGQCAPCREGTAWIKKICARIVSGEGNEKDIGLLLSLTERLKTNTLCIFAKTLADSAEAFLNKFREEFEELIYGNGKL